MAKLTLNNISSRYASVAALNDNFDLIETALENTLSRDGTSPNTMSANLDMNSKSILNVGTVNAGSLVLNGQVVSSSNISYTGVTKETQTATSGQTVFTLTEVQYSPLTNNLSVYIDGVYQNPSTYTETSSSVVTFSSGVHVGAVVDFVVFALNDLGGTGDAANITYTSAGTGAQTTTVQAKLRETVSVKDFGAVGDGVTDDTAAFNAMFATGSNVFELIAGEQYLIGDVALPTGSSWTVEGNWATIIPKSGALTCFTGTYTNQTFNTTIRNLNIQGDVTDVIKFVCTGNGVLLNCEINGITATSGTCTTLVTLNSNATGQGENFKVKNVLIFGADYDYVVYMYGGSTNYGSCEFQNIFHNGAVGVATIYLQDGLTLPSFDLIYHTRGYGVQVYTGALLSHGKFTRMETEAVEHGTVLYKGDFTNCSFDVSTIYNQALSASWTEQIASGVFKNCLFSNNFVYQTSGTTVTFATGSIKNIVTDLLVGASTYDDYTTVADSGTFSTFVGEQYTAPSTACTGAITSGATYSVVKNGQVVTLTLGSVSGTATAATSFSFGVALPAKYRPTVAYSALDALILDNGATSNTPGLVSVGTNGVISVYKSGNMTDTYTASTTAGLSRSVSLSWIL